MTPETLQIINTAISAAVPVIVIGIGGWIAARVTKIFPALSGVLTATRIAQAEEATSNAVVSQAEAIAAGKTTVAKAAADTYKTLSTSALAALAQQGTTEAQFVARVAGNAIAKMTPAVVTAPVVPIATTTAPPGSAA
jgi:hypothetical protein